MPEDVAAQFERASAGWQEKLRADEWFFAELRDRLVNPLTPSEALRGIGGVVDLILREPDSYLRSEAGQLLIALARRSDTTELHPALQERWQQVVSRLPRVEAEQVASWYRRASA